MEGKYTNIPVFDKGLSTNDIILLSIIIAVFLGNFGWYYYEVRKSKNEEKK